MMVTIGRLQVAGHPRHAEQGQSRGAPDHARRALSLYQTADHSGGQADAAYAVLWFHALPGDHRATVTYCERAIVRY